MEKADLKDEIKKTYAALRDDIKNDATVLLKDVRSKADSKKNEIYKEV